MAEVKSVEVTGEELARRVRVVLEMSIQESEPIFNEEVRRELARQVAEKLWKEKRKKLMAEVDVRAIGKEVVKAIVGKAIFNLAVEHANGND